MPRTNWQLLFVDDDLETCRQVKEFLDEESVHDPDDRLQVQTLTDFASALDELEARQIDLLILDVRLGPHDQVPEQEAGITTLEAIRQIRFVPVVFYTGLPGLVQGLETPLIQVVEKTAGLQHLLDAIRSIFASRLPQVNRALTRHLETVQRNYMWDFVAGHWDRFGDTPDRTALAYLLARRLAISLSGPGIRELAEDLGDASGAFTSEETVHPMQYYLLPPVESAPLAGDLYYGELVGETGHWLLLTPSCDMVTGREKAEWVLFARCMPLPDQSEYQQWRDSLPKASQTLTNKLQDLLRNNRQDGQAERFYFLPGAITLPDLLVDFQQLTTLPRQQLDNLQRLASLDSPFAEAVLSRFARYFGRLGTPDLDVSTIVARLRNDSQDL